jgi:hypothetical protein
MFAFACIAGGLIVACTLFALLVLSGPECTLSDIAQQMETMHPSRPLSSCGIACLKQARSRSLGGNSKEERALPSNMEIVVEERH